MDFKQAIAALKKLDAENVDELISSIEGHVSGLEEKAYNTIGESRKNAAKARATSEAMESIAKLIGIENSEDLVSALEPKLREVLDSSKAVQAKVTELETRATAAESKAQELEIETKLNAIVSVSKADPKVLKRLLGDKLGEMAIDGETVKLGNKTIQEYVEADEELKSFSPALFPNQKTEAKPAEKPANPRLPNSPPNGKVEKKDLLTSYADRAYGGLKALTKTKAVDS